MDFINPHGNKIGKLTEQFLIYLGFGSQQSKKIAYAARFHDIGKLLIPDEVLNKPGYLTKEEFSETSSHSRLTCLRFDLGNPHLVTE